MSKSETIRQFFSRFPHATNQEVVDSLGKDGIVVNANLVNQVRHDYKHKKVRESVVATSITDDEPLLKVKRLADELGGVDRVLKLALLLKQLLGEGEHGRGTEPVR